MAEDIRKTGPVGLKGLKGLNQQQEELPTLEQLQSMNRAYATGSVGPVPVDTSIQDYEGDMSQWGQSHYDEGILNAPMSSGEIQDMRYENQPWYDTLSNGIGKMLGTAGTTFLSSLVGMPYGLYQAANQGRWSALWDNDVTEGLSKANEWLEENLTNYKSRTQQESPWYSPDNLFSMNFIADDVIKNVGFTLGAAASMAVGSGALGLMGKSLGFVNEVGKGTKMGAAALSALFSATGEGMIEAKQGVDERNKLEIQKLNDSLAPEYNALQLMQDEINQRYQMTGDYRTYKEQLQDLQDRKIALDTQKATGLKQIEESGQNMGNVILLANQGLLTMGNLIQFSKGIVKGFDKARHAAEISSKAVKPTLVSASKAGTDLLRTGYKISGKNLGRAWAATKGIITEGSEEMNQQFIQSSAGEAYTEKDVNDYWKAKMDPDSYRETTQGLYTMGQILDRGFNESWGDVDQWEQFVIGGLTGMAGSYSPTKIFNQDKTKGRLNPGRYGSWEGGAYKELKEFNQQYREFEENVNEVNRILQSEDFPARVRSMVGHTYTETQMTNAANADDKKAYKDAEDKQFVHDIQSFLRAGKLDDLREIYKELGSHYSDEDIDNIVKSTTKEISAEEDKQNHDRQMDSRIAFAQTDEEKTLLLAEKDAYVGQKYYEGAYVDRQGNRIQTNDEIRKTLKHNSEELNRKLDSYLDSIDRVNKDTKGALTKDQEDNLAYLHHLGKESLVRADKIIAEKRKQMPSKFLMKTDKTPEQLSKEYASSDLVFNKDENTKQGYVEVDTSLMDDRSFRNFFIGELLWGGNIDPEFGETADEKAAREEEEKNLSAEEKKQRAKERLTKKWKESLEKRKKDAEEQRDANGDLIAQHFVSNFRKNNNANQAETQQALNDFLQDIVDASELVSQAGEYDKTLREYMANPSKVDKDKAKEETKANMQEAEKQAKNKFAGKDARQIKQEIADGTLDIDEFEDFAGADLSGITDDDVKAAQQEVKKAQEGMQRANTLKQHIQDQLGDNPTDEKLTAAQIAMQMVDDAGLAADNPSDISIDMPELNQVPLDQVDPNASLEDIEDLNNQVQGMLSEAFNALNEDKNAQDDIPEVVPPDAINDVEPPTTGHDETTRIIPEVVAPSASPSSKAPQTIVPKNPLTEGAIGNIISATGTLTNQTATSGTWRATTTRNPYGKSTGTYHDTLQDKNSIQYKRSKAIWEYLNAEGAFDRLDNADIDRIKPKDTIHFMVKYLPEVVDKDLRAMTTEERNASLAIIMMNDNGEVLGDLPLADFEPSYKSGNPSQQVKDLMALQTKLFEAFMRNYSLKGSNEVIVDGVLHKEGMDNLNLTFDNPRKSPLMSRVKQVMRGAVPYRYGEINTLNEVIQGTPELAVKVTGTNVAVKRGDRNVHKDIAIPSIGNEGQPYLLLPTASGEKIAVPFYMPKFDAEQHRNTELYKHLVNAVDALLSNNSQTTASQKEAFMKHLDALKGLLQVDRQDGVRIVDVGSDSVTLHLQSLTDPSQKYDITVPNNIGADRIAFAMVDKMSGIPINVSLQYLNDTIETGKGVPRKANYNQVIGEIANVNLPKATHHTVNSWFTVELTTQTGTKPSKAVMPKGNKVEKETPKNRRDYVKDIANAKTIQDLITIQKDAAQAQAEGVISADDLVKLSGYINQKRADIYSETPDVSDIAGNAEGAVSFEEKPLNEYTLVDYINDAQRTYQNVDWSAITKEIGQIKTVTVKTAIDGLNKILSKYLSKDEINALRYDAVNYFWIDEVAKNIAKNSLANASSGKSIEEIEAEAKQKKIVTRQTKDAWAAIPDDLKLKMFNKSATLQLAYFTQRGERVFKNSVVTISLSDREGLIKALITANIAAKAGNLRVQEAVKPMERNNATLSKEKESAARRWLAKNLPSLSSEERTQFVDKLARMGDNAGKYWGSYRSGVIQIQRNAPMGTVYHEAFHYVLDMILDPEERKQIIDIAKQEYGVSDGWMAEEMLANDFRRYAMDENAEGIIGKIKRWLRKLKDKMIRYNRISDATINQLFWKINNGELAEKSEYIENFEETQQKVLREIRNVQNEKLAWSNLPSDTKAAIKSSGLSEAAYNEMSIEEKDQYIKCRG